MSQERDKLFLGGPGCGKTTALLDVIDSFMTGGFIPPHEIAYVAFTRKAAREARTRVCERFDLSAKDIPHFRTLHSFAYQRVTQSTILNEKALREFAEKEQMELSKRFIDEFGIKITTPSSNDERVLACISKHKLTNTPLADIVTDEELNLQDVLYLWERYEKFKDEHKILDFTDVLTEYVLLGVPPKLELLIVDEAQDLSWLQWEMVRKLRTEAVSCYLAGDDDQAIYAWAGADIDTFLNLDAERTVLPISYRLKSRIFEACQKVITQSPIRYEKVWKPYTEGGEVTYISDLDQIDLSQGSWFLLARTNGLVRRFVSYLQREGYPYLTMTADGLISSVEVTIVKAVLLYENLRMGRAFSPFSLDIIWEALHPKHKPADKPVWEGKKKYDSADFAVTGFNLDLNWIDAIAMSGSMQSYIRALRARGESLTDTPRITASTIHGVKGGEADNVVIMQQLSRRTHKAWIEGDPQEIRTLFTAMSRAKDRLIFLNSQNQVSYQVEKILQ